MTDLIHTIATDAPHLMGPLLMFALIVAAIPVCFGIVIIQAAFNPRRRRF
jgi:hypothetical protein